VWYYALQSFSSDLWESPFPAAVVLMVLTMVSMVSMISIVVAAPLIPPFSVVSASAVQIIGVDTTGNKMALGQPFYQCAQFRL